MFSTVCLEVRFIQCFGKKTMGNAAIEDSAKPKSRRKKQYARKQFKKNF